MKILISIVLVVAGFYIALWELDQSLSSYWDLVAFAIVIAGTFSVMILTSPSHSLKDLTRSILFSLSNRQGLRKRTVEASLSFIRNAPHQLDPKKSLNGKLLSDGEELISLGFNKERVTEILNGRLHKWFDDKMQVVNWIRALAKYPPAFGLSATVLGLIQVMNSLSDNGDPRATALKMAIALVATFYGILVANLFVAPLGDRLKANVLEEYHLSQITLKTIMLKMDGVAPLEAQECLLSHLGESQQREFTMAMAA